MNNKRAIVIGLTGPNASGKGTVAELLQKRGFGLHSLSDIVREEARAAGLTTGRDHLIVTGNRLRREGGAGVLALRILPRLAQRRHFGTGTRRVWRRCAIRLEGFPRDHRAITQSGRSGTVRVGSG